MDPVNLAQWAGAIGTFSAVVVALFNEPFVGRWRQPTLNARIKLEPPDCNKTIWVNPAQGSFIMGPLSADCYYLRLWIDNSGRSRAQQLQVYASKLSRQLPDGSFEEERNFFPMNLRWSNSREVYAEGMSAYMGKHCDLAHIIDPAKRKLLPYEETNPPSQGTILSLDLEAKPNTLGHLVKPGTYRLELRIAAANARPITRQVEFTCTGKWFDDERQMFQDGIRMRLIE